MELPSHPLITSLVFHLTGVSLVFKESFHLLIFFQRNKPPPPSSSFINYKWVDNRIYFLGICATIFCIGFLERYNFLVDNKKYNYNLEGNIEKK